jgi:hypothetical protein
MITKRRSQYRQDHSDFWKKSKRWRNRGKGLKRHTTQTQAKMDRFLKKVGNLSLQITGRGLDQTLVGRVAPHPEAEASRSNREETNSKLRQVQILSLKKTRLTFARECQAFPWNQREGILVKTKSESTPNSMTN